ncbi:Gustatory receptor [Aphis craccivora]|uniref:Gustatory receptor n=1 Tax=Aphis craccivora TaxID=307492 RepID=A0A6G0YXP1_APHCR|nr:Gustatory receptor [Aphis craccivora]
MGAEKVTMNIVVVGQVQPAKAIKSVAKATTASSQLMVKHYHPEVFDSTTSLILMSCFEFVVIGQVISHMWHLFIDKKLSMALSKLEAVNKILIQLNVVRPMKWMVYVINEQILEKKLCISTLRSINLEVVECLKDINGPIYGISAMINRISLLFYQKSVIEKNPRIKRQIKLFLLRRLHEHFHFELYGICHINPRKLLTLSNKAFAYLVIQIQFKLNKT